MKQPTFSLSLLHPRYWLTWVSLGLMALVAQLPYRFQIWMGKKLGDASYHIFKRRRDIAQKNIDLCFAEWSEDKREALVREHFQTNGITLFETGMAWFMPYWRLRKLFVAKTPENWEAVQKKGQGALVIGLHFNTLEIANVLMSRLFDFHVSYRAHDNPVYNLIQHRGRKRHTPNYEAINRYDIRGMIRVLKQGGLLWYAPDQDYGPKASEFIPWFGIPAATVASTPRLLKMANVPAVGVAYRRLPGYKGYEVEFMSVIEGVPSGDDHKDLVAVNQHVEACVRRNPAEYLWVHRRFKTRPQGEAKIY